MTVPAKQDRSEPDYPLSDWQSFSGVVYPDVASVLHVAATRLNRVLRDEMARELRKHRGLKLPEWRVLILLNTLGWTPQKQLVEAVDMEQAQVSRALSAMQEDGLVASRRGVTDKRVWQFNLTEEGRALYARVRPHMIARRDDLDRVLSDTERAQFINFVERISERAAQR